MRTVVPAEAGTYNHRPLEYGSPPSRGRQLGETHETLLLGYSRGACVRPADGTDRARAGLSLATDHLDRTVARGRSSGRALPRGRAAPVGPARQVGGGGESPGRGL